MTKVIIISLALVLLWSIVASYSISHTDWTPVGEAILHGIGTVGKAWRGQ